MDYNKTLGCDLNGANISEQERQASVIGGGVLALYGLSRRSFGGVLLALLGGALMYRGVTRRCMIYQKFGINTAEIDYDAYYENRAANDAAEKSGE